MDNHSEEERNISTEDILKTLDRFGSKTPSPVEDVGRLIAMEPSPETGKFCYDSSYVSTAGKNRLRIRTVSKISVGLVKYPLLNKPISDFSQSYIRDRVRHMIIKTQTQASVKLVITKIQLLFASQTSFYKLYFIRILRLCVV